MLRTQLPTLLAVYLGLGLPQAADPQDPPQGGSNGAMFITKAVADLTDPAKPRIAIHGENLGSTPEVFLGEDIGSLVPLAVQAAIDTVIVADLPVALGPGTYILVVRAAAGSANTDIIDVTFGGEGLQGSQESKPPEVPGAGQGQQSPAGLVSERLQASGADLKTAKTIYIEQMSEDLHRHIVARLNHEGGPYKVEEDKNQADLLMIGTATAVQHREPGQWEEVARIIAKEPKQRQVSLTASVYIVARGSKEVLWSTEATDLMGVTSTSRGPRQQVARVIVTRLQKAIKKLKKK